MEKLNEIVIEYKINNLNKNFDIMKNDIGEMKKDMGAMKNDFGEMKKDMGAMKNDICEMKNTMDTLLLFSFSKDAYCPANQKIKMRNILEKQREKILRKFNNSNPNNKINNQINKNISTPIREKKIKTPTKKDKPAFSNKSPKNKRK